MRINVEKRKQLTAKPITVKSWFMWFHFTFCYQSEKKVPQSCIPEITTGASIRSSRCQKRSSIQCGWYTEGNVFPYRHTCLPLPGYTHTLIHMKQLETKLAGYFVQFFSTSCTAILSSLLYGIPISRCNIDSLYSEHQKSVHYKLQVCFPEGCITKQMHVCVYYTYILWLSE